MNKKVIAISTIVLLLVGIAGIAFYAWQQQVKNREMTELFAVEKQEMENEYSAFAQQYNELKIQINNDSLKYKLENERIKTQRLLEELRQVKSTNAAEILRLKKELATVRAVMRSYIVQIDSLNKVNEALKQENQEVKQKYTAATEQISSLSVEKKNLNEKVALAAQLDATNIYASLLDKKGKPTKKAKNVKNVAIHFTIVKNITASTGDKNIYVRIAKPNNEILTKNADTFPYEGKQLSYSIKKYIEYTGEELKTTVYWNVEEFLDRGTYRVYLFADGIMIGEGSFNME